MSVDNGGALTVKDVINCNAVYVSAAWVYTGGNTLHQNGNKYNAWGQWLMGVNVVYGCAAKDFLTFSDIRIRKNIQDINDDAALSNTTKNIIILIKFITDQKQYMDL